LPRRHASFRATTAIEQIFARLLSGGSQVVVDSLTGLLCQLKPNGLPSLLLTNGCPVGCVAAWGNILNPQGNDIAAAEFAIDYKIKHREIACPSLQLQLDPD
jgi:hypothetical protein